MNLITKGLEKIVPIFVVNAWAYTDPCESQFEEAALYEYLLSIVNRRCESQIVLDSTLHDSK